MMRIKKMAPPIMAILEHVSMQFATLRYRMDVLQEFSVHHLFYPACAYLRPLHAATSC